MVIKLTDYSGQFESRFAGAAIRDLLQKSLQKESRVLVDFSDIDIISYPFADECFAKLLDIYSFEYLKDSLSFVNASSFIISRIIKSFSNRIVNLQNKVKSEPDDMVYA